MQVWLTSKIKEAIRGEKVSFKKWKLGTTEGKERHKMWQHKCKVARQAKKVFEGLIASNIKTKPNVQVI